MKEYFAMGPKWNLSMSALTLVLLMNFLGPCETVLLQGYLSGIDVIYTDDANSKPDGIIQEVDGKNPDINAGFGGKFVSLVPKWTTRLEEGVTSIQVLVQDVEDKTYQDLAKGAGGQYRYLQLSKDSSSGAKITKLVLWRTDKKYVRPSDKSMDVCTTDINKGRQKDYLYLCWISV